MHDWASEIRGRLGRVGRTPEVEAAVVEELAQHLEDRYAELRAAGADHTAAVTETLEELSDDPLLGEQLGRARRSSHRSAVPIGTSDGGNAVETLWGDLRQGVRLAARKPAYTAAIVLTLALGIGATTAIFSVVNTILLRDAPFAEMDELVMVWETDRDSETYHEPASWQDIVDFRERSRTLEGIGAMGASEMIWRRDDGDAEPVSTLSVTGNLPSLLGVALILGTPFDGERVANGEPAVLVGERIWRSRMGADPAIVGSTIHLNGEPRTVVGVLPSEADLGVNQIYGRADYGGQFTGRHVDFWIGIGNQFLSQFQRANHPFLTVGRLAPGATIDAAQNELAAIAAELEATYPENAARGVNLEGLAEVIFGPTRPALLVLIGAVALVLLITCANVANLMMARMVVRRRELSVRTALGAPRRRIASQILMETLVVTMLGAIAGLALAYAGIRWIVALAPDSIPRMDQVTIDWTVLAVLLGVTVAVALLLAFMPLRLARRSELGNSLRAAVGGRSPNASLGGRTRAALVISQTALAVALVIGAGVLLRSFTALLAVDPGFETERVISTEFQLPAGPYFVELGVPETYASLTSFYTELLDRVRAIPGVEQASIALDHPLDPGTTNSFVIVGREAESADFPEIRTRFVSPSYSETLGVPLLAGRMLSDTDDAEAPLVSVLNRAAAERYFPDQDPIGQEIRLWGMSWRVVGVMGDERFLGLDRNAEPATYASLQQVPLGSGVLLVRTSRTPTAVTATIQNAFREIDPQVVAYGAETLDETLLASLGRPRFMTTLIGMFAALAALIALVGLNGLLSYSVSQRAPELGIRKALGASEGDLKRLVLNEGFRLAAAGVGLGVLLALAGSRMLESLVFGVSPADPLTFVAVTLLVLAAALLASWIPARRASASDPLALLRSE